MKQLTKISALILFITLFSITSCKKDEEDLKYSDMDLVAEYNGVWTLNLYQNELDIRGKIAPKDAPSSQIELRITSNADPVGFKFTANLTNSDFTEGKVKYLYKNLNTSVTAGNFTDANRKIIKVDSTGDHIAVSLGNNLLNGNFPINSSDIVSLTYWPYDHTATLFLRGYRFNGNEDKNVYVWTSRDPYPLLINLQYDDPLQYAGLPNFNSFNTSLQFMDGPNAFPNFLGVFFQNDLVFVDYGGVVYSSVLGENTFAPLVRTQMKSKTKK